MGIELKRVAGAAFDGAMTGGIGFAIASAFVEEDGFLFSISGGNHFKAAIFGAEVGAFVMIAFSILSQLLKKKN